MVVLVALLLAPSPVHGSADGAPGPAPPEAVEHLAVGGAEAAIVAEATDLYADAGLELPADLGVTFHDTIDACDSNLATVVEDDGYRVRICWAHEHPAVEQQLRTQALVHELAHVWMRANLADETRQAYLDFTGLASWRSAATPWAERGCEHAAELITKKLLDPPVPFIDFSGEPCEHWDAAYAVLTGAVAPAP